MLVIEIWNSFDKYLNSTQEIFDIPLLQYNKMENTSIPMLYIKEQTL